MQQRTLNLGILAHVDAGKTTLTERLLHTAGAIDEPGSVDAGTTQTDSLALERQRGITIKSAVASFAVGDVTVNLIDTPGHPDFIAEVERVLGVLDGAVLVISAVEGVQPQTRVLMRALQRLRVPTLFFVNKVDRAGADDERVAREVAERLAAVPVPLGTVRGIGTRAASVTPFDPAEPQFRSRLAEVLAEHDDDLLASYVEDDSSVPYGRLRDALAAQTAGMLVHPLFPGSALTGAGVEELMDGIAELLPASEGDPEGPLSATVFKIERAPRGEKVAYVRVFSGTIRVRDRLRFDSGAEEKVTALAVFERGPAARRPSALAGAVAKVSGLAGVRIGDRIGEQAGGATQHRFPPPTLESVVTTRDSRDRARLRVALAQLDEADPLIDVRRNDLAGELSVSLYGEVQKEVIAATLADDYGLDVSFHETTPIYVERPVGTGEAVEILRAEGNPFLATIGLRVEPGPVDSGIEFRVAVHAQSLPLYLYKNVEGFSAHMEDYVRLTLREGLCGWSVEDCVVTLTRCTYSVPDGPPSRSGPLSTSVDFRKLTPLVLMQALERAGTVVCEPVVSVRLELPTESIGAAIAALARLGANPGTPSLQGTLATLEAVLPAVRAQSLLRQLPELTGGEGTLETAFSGYRPVAGDAPTRRRTTPNPLNRAEYLSRSATGQRRESMR